MFNFFFKLVKITKLPFKVKASSIKWSASFSAFVQLLPQILLTNYKGRNRGEEKGKEKDSKPEKEELQIYEKGSFRQVSVVLLSQTLKSILHT